MSGAATQQLNRIVSLVAELTRRDAAGEGDATVAELAERFGTTGEQIRRDVVTLTAASDEAGAEWLSSIGVLLEGDRLSITSRGPFRRPLRFTPLELAAIQVGLAADATAPPALSKALAGLVADGAQDAAHAAAERMRVAPEAGEGEWAVVRLAQHAMDRRRVLRIRYAGLRDRVGIERTVEVHDTVYHEGHYYLMAWCRRSDGWRYFRADRVLEGELGEASFAWRSERPDAAARGVFGTADEPDAVDVRFSRDIARWIVERFPDARGDADGSVVVTYRVADPHWLVRTVLQYGAEAEVVGPPEYRALVAHALRAG